MLEGQRHRNACMVGGACVSRLEEGGKSLLQTLQVPGGQQGDRLREKGR